MELLEVRERPSPIFWIYLKFLGLFRPLHLWLARKFPDFFARYLGPAVNLDTSRMLPRFNALHHWFFRRGFEKIGFDEDDLDHLKAAQAKGPPVFLMKNWGQVEYNYFNHLFLKKKLPLVAHNNLIKMGHWMPWRDSKAMRRQKIDRYLRERAWPYNNQIFDLAQTLREDKPVLYCLDLPKGSLWVEKDLGEQETTVLALMEAQEKLSKPLQLVPLHFIYDKHPGPEKDSLTDIFFGDRENPDTSARSFYFCAIIKNGRWQKSVSPSIFKACSRNSPMPPRETRSAAF
jgi:hypothetical protein